MGTELLLGQVANTDAQYISQRLSALGVSVYRHTVVGDNEARLNDALTLALKRSDAVILTGGLGPTEDDLTKETVAKHFGRALVLDEASVTHIREFLARAGRPARDGSFKEALSPEGAYIMPNELGTAPGCVLEAQGKLCAILPGPPRELERMFEKYLLPYLEARTDKRLCSKYLHIFGMGEPVVEQTLIDLFHLGAPTLALYCSTCEVCARISALVERGADANEIIDPVAREIKKRVGGALYAEGLNATLASTLLRMLKERGETIALAESLTGGLLTSALIDLPGASSAVLEGYIVYSNAAKTRLLGVSEDTLRNFGAVSQECALEIARGARKASGAHWALSTTGIAGPDGGTPNKRVGLVYIALSGAGGDAVIKREFNGDRANVRISSVKHALNLLRERLISLNDNTVCDNADEPV